MHNRTEQESEPKFFFVKETKRGFTNFRSAKFHEICTQHVDLRGGASFRNKILKTLQQGVFLSKKATFARKSSRNFRLQATISPKWLQIVENHDGLASLRNVDFPLLPLESTRSHSRGLYSAHTESTLSPKTLFRDIHAVL